MVSPPFLTSLCVSRCGPLLSGPGSGLCPVLLPQHHAHSTLPQQTDGPGDGLTNTFPRTHTLQRSQEIPHTQQTHVHRRFLGHPVVSRRGTLGVKWRIGDRSLTDRSQRFKGCSGFYSSAVEEQGTFTSTNGEIAFETSISMKIHWNLWSFQWFLHRCICSPLRP